MKSAAIEVVGIVMYLLVLQHLMSSYVFEKPDESWLRIAWRWAASRHEVWWQQNVAVTYNRPGSAAEPTPKPTEPSPEA